MALSLHLFDKWLNALARPRVLAWWFMCCALPTGLASALLTPIGQFPDEMAHIIRADGLRYGHVFGMRPPPGFPPMTPTAGVPLNKGLFDVLVIPQWVGLTAGRGTPARVQHQAEEVKWGKASYWPTQMVEYLPVFYIPAALGLLAGQVVGFSPLHALLLGRVAMLLCYVALGAAALALARFGGALLFAVLTLPTLLNLAGSFNQDAPMVAGFTLAAALLTRTEIRAWAAGLAVLSLTVSAKLAYAPLLLLGLTPLLAPGLHKRLLGVALAALLPGLWLLHVLHGGFIPAPVTPYHPAPLWPGNRSVWLHSAQPSDNIQVLLAHPWEIVRLPVITLIFFWPQTWRLILGMVGCDHGLIWAWEYPALVAALGMAMLGALAGRARGWRMRDGMLACLAVFAAFLGMELSMYLTFTPAGYLVAMGVQGRYFLPFLPFFIFVLAGLGSGLARVRLPEGLFCGPAMALAGINLVALPWLVWRLYHGAGP